MSKKPLTDSEKRVIDLLSMSSGLSVYQIAYRTRIDRKTLRRMLRSLLERKEIYRNVVMKKYNGIITMQVSDYNTKYFKQEQQE